MTTRIKLRRDTAANWTSNNPILAAGEPGLETDTGKTKYGDGTTHWADLSYATGGITARTAIGSFTGYGPSIPNTSGWDAWYDTVVADPDGNAYYLGGHNNGPDWMVAVKVDSDGEVVWQKEVSWADGYEGSGTSAVYNTATDQLVVVGTFYKNTDPGFDNESAVVMTLDPADGTLIGDPTVIRDDITADDSQTGWVGVSDVILTTGGDPVICGEMGGAPQVYAVTTATGSTINDLFVDSAQFLDQYPAPYDNWYISGTNITSEVNLTGVNYYYNYPVTNIAGGTGTNALFDITADGSGGYTVTLGTDQGSGYRYLNKILILGSLLGGSDGVNDATVTVQGVDAGVITSASVGGTSTGSGTYTGVSGTNIPGGSNATFSAEWRMKGSQVWFPDYSAKFGVRAQGGGSGYATGDTLALAPEAYGGSTTGTITVTNMDGNGSILDWEFTGTFNTSIVKLTTQGDIDYGVVDGAYFLRTYQSQSYVWSPSWSKTFGGSNWDKANAMARDSNGNIYIAGKTYDRSVNSGVSRALLVKLSSDGSFVWSKNFDPLNWDRFDNGYTGVVVDSNNNIIVIQGEQVTKLDADGVVLWQQVIAYNDPLDMWNGCVDVDSDDNIYIASEYSWLMGLTNDNFLIFKLDTDGNVLWQREAGTATEESAYWNDGYQIITVQGNRFYVCGSTYQGNDDIAFAMNMPTDGSGARNEFTGRYLYSTSTWSLTTTTTSTVDTMEIVFTSTEFTVYTTNTFAVNTLTYVTEVRSIRTGDVDGRINNLYSLGFEDGTEQTTAYTGGYSLAADSPRIYDTNDYLLNLSDAGKMRRWIAGGWGNTVNIYVPNNNDVPFEIGTQIHFMKDDGIRAFMFWNGANGNDDDVTIMPAQPADGMQGNAYNSGEGWSVRHPNWDWVPCIATLTKVDTNRWLLTCNSSVHIMDWSY